MNLPQSFSDKSAMAHDIKLRNLRNLALYLLSLGEMTKMDLLQQSGLSTTTISDLINHLLRLGIVVATGIQKSTGGRQPAVYHIDKDYGLFLGITITYDQISLTVTDMHAQPRNHSEYSIHANDNLLYTLHRAIDEAMNAFSSPSFLAIGLGLPGSLDVKHGTVLESPIAEWNNVPIKEILERRHNLPVYVDNNVSQGALYQQVLGEARNQRNFLCHFARYPDRAALVLDGVLCRGKDNTCLTLGTEDPKHRIDDAVTMLGLEAVLTDCADETDGPHTIPLSLPDTFFETAAALMAEVFWFESIYTLHAKSTPKKEKIT